MNPDNAASVLIWITDPALRFPVLATGIFCFWCGLTIGLYIAVPYWQYRAEEKRQKQKAEKERLAAVALAEAKQDLKLAPAGYYIRKDGIYTGDSGCYCAECMNHARRVVLETHPSCLFCPECGAKYRL
nr:MAG TPA: Lipopolysaccharide assembly protein A domain [Caudoviricetes sp.]